MIRIDTERSVYLFDEAGRYCRMPRDESPRDEWERGQQALSGGPMDDHVWNDVKFVRLMDMWPEGPSLNIHYPGAKFGIVTTPIASSSLDDARRLCEIHPDPQAARVNSPEA